MFTSSADETVHKAGLFGAVFFKTTKVNGGVTGSMGIGNIVPLIIIFGIFFVFFFIMQGVYRGLRDRRDTLLTTREDPSGKMS